MYHPLMTSWWKKTVGLAFALVLVPILMGVECAENSDTPPLILQWGLSWESGADRQAIARTGSAVLNLNALNSTPTTPEPHSVCYHKEGVTVEPACFFPTTDTAGEFSSSTPTLTTSVRVRADAPLGDHDLSRQGSLEIQGASLPETARITVSSAPATTASISSFPGLHVLTGNSQVIIETAEIRAVARNYVIRGKGVDAPTSGVIPAGQTRLVFDATPTGEGHVSIEVEGDGKVYKLDDLRLAGKPEAVRGLHEGNGRTFVKGIGIRSDLTYTHEETSGLFGASTLMRVKGTFSYGGSIFNVDVFMDTAKEDTIVIPNGAEKFLLTHAFGAPGEITMSFNHLDASNINIDSLSYETFKF